MLFCHTTETAGHESVTLPPVIGYASDTHTLQRAMKTVN